jgi:hypothetical protein
VANFRGYGQFAIAALAGAWIWAQPPGPPGPPPLDRVAEVRRKLDRTKPIDVTAQRALTFGRAFLESATTAQQAGKVFQADRLAGAAEAMVHVAEHQLHLRNGGGLNGPPPHDSVTDQLQRVYFRIQQADYFLKQSRDSRATAFPKWARDFYQLAVRGHERKDQIAATENAKSAEDVVKCLEDLAQAATVAEPPNPAPKPATPPA